MEKAIEILKTGISIEKNGLSTYLNFAYKTKEPTGKNMFIKLAQDELQHMEVLEKMLDGIMCNRTWVCETIPESFIEKIAPRIRAIDKMKSEEGQDELSALKTALDLEKRSIEFYNENKRFVNNPEAIKIFDRIIEMEESHYDLIQAEIDHIEQTGFWFGIREFTMEGERE
uniref:Rubrerythrin n=1 Tax=candidate division WOR-3 bacterium TaxID=2052148 RepID=A0A7V1EH54_UNCW3